MLAKTIDDRGTRQSIARTEFEHGIGIPSCDSGEVRIIEGRAVMSTEYGLEYEKLMLSLRTADRLTLRKLFHTLSPPPIDSLVGEYDGELLSQGGPICTLLTGRVFGMYGAWIGKAFCPVGESTGVGYNYFQSGGTVVRKLSMTTTIETSVLDDGPSLKISYNQKNRGIITWLFGEVRQVTANVMLGVGIIGPTLGRAKTLQRRIPFVLVGPRRPYQDLPSS